MSDFAIKQPKITGLRNERSWQEGNRFDEFFSRCRESTRKVVNKVFRDDDRIVAAVMRRGAELENLPDTELAKTVEAVRAMLRLKGLERDTIIEAFSVIRESSGRALGMRHHHTQIRVSIALLRGCVAEMATGEGKTLAATLATATAGLAGIPVHVVTVNDYLAERDALDMLPLYTSLGLTVGIITHEKQRPERRDAYSCHVCYCSNKELTFDFLKDRLVLDGRENPRKLQAKLLTQDQAWASELMLRGLHFAVVDEADSVLIDESRTPLIISGAEKFGSREESLLKTAMEIASHFERGEHFSQDETSALHLTKSGHSLLVKSCQDLEGLWKSPFYREPLVRQALAALHSYDLDRDYIIDAEGAVQIVDTYTGRVMPGRSWGQGLQQMIELKEGCEITKPRDTDAEISYQNFFRKYHHLSGMTGTGREVGGELLDVYRLRGQVIPLLKPSQRKSGYTEVYRTESQKWQRVSAIVAELVEHGQAVLIGTNSVSSSEVISQFLEADDIAHKVLNARQDREEAEIVSHAGESGAVTVATSMAGRGTDIKLTSETRAAGGLHVIITELQDASRIDRQLAGRCARQGDPGMVSEILSMEDRLIRRVSRPMMRKVLDSSVYIPSFVGLWLQRRSQKKIESSHKSQRQQLIRVDSHRQRTMAFSGDIK